MNMILPKTTLEAAKIIAQCVFLPFDEMDWQIFAGCKSDHPKICYLGDEETGLAIVQDGDTFYFQNAAGEFADFMLVEGV
jgi:hypothetical protein